MNSSEQKCSGQESTFLDGFRMALMLREEAPEAFNYFTATPLKYYTMHENVDVESWGVVFSLCPMTGKLRQARRRIFS